MESSSEIKPIWATTNPNLPYILDHITEIKFNWNPFSNFEDETVRKMKENTY
jgi:hypothetical protein